MKLFRIFLLAMATVAVAQTPAPLVQLQAGNLKDASGDGNVADGSMLCVVTTDQNDRPMGYRTGSTGGQTNSSTGSTGSCRIIKGGTLSSPLYVINSAASSPLNACLRITITGPDGSEVSRRKCVQTGTADSLSSGFCTAGSAGGLTVCNLDNYTNSGTLLMPVGSGKQGPQGVPGPGAVLAGNGQARSLAVAAALTAGSVNAVINVALASGSDLGQQVANSIAALNGSCGTMVIPQGTYLWTKRDVLMDPCMSLIGTGAIVNVPSLQHPALVIARPSAAPSSAATLTWGQVRDITFVGPGVTDTTRPANGPNGTVPAIWYGGDFSGIETPNTSFQAELTDFFNVHITGFTCGVKYGNGFQTSWFGGAFEANDSGVCFQDGLEAIENIAFVGTNFLNNYHHAIDHEEDGAFVEFSCHACSFDYNGQDITGSPQVVWTNGTFASFGGHFEGPQLPMVKIKNPSSGVTANMSFSGMNWSYQPRANNPSASFIEVDGLNDFITIGDGNTFGASTDAVTSVANWNTIGSGYNNYYVRPYTAATTNNHTIPALSGPTVPESYDIPVYNVYGLRVGVQTSLTPAYSVVNGLPPATALLSGGNFQGWNRTVGSGHSDVYMSPGNGSGGIDYWSPNAGKTDWVKVATMGSQGDVQFNHLQLTGLQGSGNAVACLSSNGTFYRSTTSPPCQ